MSDDKDIIQILVGLSCTSVHKAEYSWHLIFGKRRVSLNLECPWRLLVEGVIVFGGADHGHQFGLPAPVEGEVLAKKVLSTSPIMSIEVRTGTSDLAITFENGATLEAFNSSAGYEAWTISDTDPLGFLAVAQGGGNLEVWLPGATKSKSGFSSRHFGSAQG
jgi:hypothetical protein